MLSDTSAIGCPKVEHVCKPSYIDMYHNVSVNYTLDKSLKIQLRVLTLLLANNSIDPQPCSLKIELCNF